MKRFMNKKVAAIGLAAGLALGAAGAAFAYFSSTGSGKVRQRPEAVTASVTLNARPIGAIVPGRRWTDGDLHGDEQQQRRAMSTVSRVTASSPRLQRCTGCHSLARRRGCSTQLLHSVHGTRRTDRCRRTARLS